MEGQLRYYWGEIQIRMCVRAALRQSAGRQGKPSTRGSEGEVGFYFRRHGSIFLEHFPLIFE